MINNKDISKTFSKFCLFLKNRQEFKILCTLEYTIEKVGTFHMPHSVFPDFKYFSKRVFGA